MSCERPYYEDLNYSPLLFYVIFGVKDEELNVSRERHHVDKLPEGLDFSILTKAKNGTYMSTLIGGTLGEILEKGNPDLYKALQNAEKWAVLGGKIQQDADLNYMRNAIGFVQAIVENEAIGVLDLPTFTLFTAKEWTEKIFQQAFNPYDHVKILTSEMEDGSVWLHTRGMRKFGRPDISMEKVERCEMEQAVQVVNQLLYYGAAGAFFSRPVKLHTHDGQTYIVEPEFVDDIENPDYNNSYYRILWEDSYVTET